MTVSDSHEVRARLDPDALLPSTLLARYLFFLSRRPVSVSNQHFRSARLAALQALAHSVENKGDEDFEDVLEAIRVLTPSNLFRGAPSIEERLRPYIRNEFRRHLIVCENAPPKSFLNGARRVLVAFGPGIGIGDEIICFPLPAAIRQLAPACEITVLSWYDGLWHTNQNVAGVERCDNFGTLLRMLRSSAFDVVFFVDFEDPRLSAAIAREPDVARYVEVSLGARSVAALDNVHGRVYQYRAHSEYYANFYRCFARMLEWLGADSVAADAASAVPGDHATILFSPFTSKEEPSEIYWTRLIAAIAGEG